MDSNHNLYIKILFGFLIFFLVSTAQIYASSYDCIFTYDYFANKINQGSLINPSNFYKLPSTEHKLTLNPIFSFNQIPNFSFLGDISLIYLSDNISTENSYQVSDGTYTVNRLLMNYNISDFTYLSFGKDKLKFGNSQFDTILNLGQEKKYYTGSWGASAHIYQELFNLSFYVIPTYNLNVNKEFLNQNKNLVTSALISSYWFDVDSKLLFNAEWMDSAQFYTALSLSYNLPFARNIIMYFDSKIINDDYKYQIK